MPELLHLARGARVTRSSLPASGMVGVLESGPGIALGMAALAVRDGREAREGGEG